MTELVALAAIVAVVAIVALVVGRPFSGRAGTRGIELEAGGEQPDVSRQTKAGRSRKGGRAG